MECANCRFFQASNVPDSAFVPDYARRPGLCRRFPAYVDRQPGHWCGEHRPVDA